MESILCKPFKKIRISTFGDLFVDENITNGGTEDETRYFLTLPVKNQITFVKANKK